MNFAESISVLKEGKLVGRRAQSNKHNNVYIDFHLGCLWKRTPQGRYTKSELYILCLDDINAIDWEEVEK